MIIFNPYDARSHVFKVITRNYQGRVRDFADFAKSQFNITFLPAFNSEYGKIVMDDLDYFQFILRYGDEN